MMPRKIGYARVSALHQNLDRQIAALRAEQCDRVFREKASGKSTKGRPELEKAIDALGTGDILVVAEWDRATRSMLDGVALIERINAKGALLKVLDRAHLDLTTPIGRGVIAFLSAMAEDERQRSLAGPMADVRRRRQEVSSSAANLSYRPSSVTRLAADWQPANRSGISPGPTKSAGGPSRG
jgi:DNA invertase Pin-like site-specific DNA recombinase